MQFYKNLFFCIVLCLGGGWFMGLITRQGINDWYNHLIQPPGTPPNIVFPLVWTVLYVLMALSLALFLSSPSSDKKLPLVFFALQLILNFSWSWLFFGLKSPGAAMLDLVLLWACIIGTMILFKKHSAISTYLLIPYLAWVTYAGYLNLFIWLKNS